MKFGQLIKYNKGNIFPQNHAENEAERLVQDLFLFFKKVLFEVQLSGPQFSFNIVLTLHTLKTNCIKF